MSNSVLVAVEGNGGSARALSYASERAKLNGAKLIVTYVIEWSPYSFNIPEENAERHMRREPEIERAEAHVVESAAVTLIKLAEKHAVQQVAIGRRGLSGIKNLLFGTVAGKLAQTWPVPFVVP